jgi:Helix-turn-helix domain
MERSQHCRPRTQTNGSSPHRRRHHSKRRASPARRPVPRRQGENVDASPAGEFLRSHKQNPAMVAEMDRLLDDFNYADVARILNEKGYKTGDGLPLTSPAVGYIRTAYGLKSRYDRLRERGMLTLCEAARRYGVSANTVSSWRRRNRIPAYAINDRNRFLFEDPGPKGGRGGG